VVRTNFPIEKFGPALDEWGKSSVGRKEKEGACRRGKDFVRGINRYHCQLRGRIVGCICVEED